MLALRTYISESADIWERGPLARKTAELQLLCLPYCAESVFPQRVILTRFGATPSLATLVTDSAQYSLIISVAFVSFESDYFLDKFYCLLGRGEHCMEEFICDI